jgi:hypothetical protein
VREPADIPAFRPWIDFLTAWLERRTADMVARRDTLGHGLRIMEDPEAVFQEAWLFIDAGEHERGIGLLRQSVANGYYPAATLANGRSFAPLRGDPAFQAVLADAEAGRRRALEAFREGGGERLLGR